MIFESESELRDRIDACAHRRPRGAIEIVDDTTNYMQISGGTVLRVGGSDYFLTGEATEGRFGIGDQPKFWVKYAWDLTTGTRKIIKLVFHEEFTVQLGFFTVRCARDPDKESGVLELVRGDRRFMQGETVHDAKGNNVRIIDYIKGPTLYSTVAELEQSHEEYFHSTLPGVMEKVVGCIDALAHLERNGFQHGDVRNDHIIIESGTGEYRWIDFDFGVNYQDFDVWSVGNILTYVVGKGLLTCQDARQIQEDIGSAGNGWICENDALVFFKHRVANIRKVYPYVPKELNEIMTRFSASTQSFYEDLETIARDVRGAIALL